MASRKQQKSTLNTTRSSILGRRVKKQEGITGIAMALILALIAFFALIVLRLSPIYIEYFNVKSHVTSLKEDATTKEKTNAEIYDTLRKRFRIDDVKNVTAEEISISRESGVMKILVEYEVRTPALGNVDMVVNFSDEVVVN